MTLLLLKLILAHLIGDFFLQPKKWVKDKEKKKLASLWLYAHILIHVVLMFLIVWDASYWKLILSIGLIHFVIDALKLLLQTKKNKRWLFFIDQLLHVITIFGLATFFYRDSYEFVFTFDPKQLILIICILFLTMPTSIIMGIVFSKWNLKKIAKDNESLKDAGKYIGILERLLVFAFIALDHWEAVGFLITAKSVFRFGDISNSKERQLTEYILIGTLLSFGIAILVGLLYLSLINYV
ncbi:DUF3307 domain-containing protein [Winogradskyella sp. A3E31]|uniref:DUF3307 domain-containing protein n=1 Tax=Winogradskyella sp. A3E31 TaxID=3349637 RepID=UPI00398A67AC